MSLLTSQAVEVTDEDRIELQSHFPYAGVKLSELSVQEERLILYFLRGMSKAAAGRAAAGLKRLKLEERIRSFIAPEQSLPAVGQGAVGIECRLDDERLIKLLEPLNDKDTADRVLCERAMNLTLEGGCQVPIGSYSLLDGDNIWLRALVGEPDGSKMVRGEISGSRKDAEALGITLANQLLDDGAREILTKLYADQE